jgi:hypothetical protein
LFNHHHGKTCLPARRGKYHIDIPFSLHTQAQVFAAAGFRSVSAVYQDERAAVFVAVA